MKTPSQLALATALLSIFSPALTSPVTPRDVTSAPPSSAPVKHLYAFSPPVFLENLYPRPNGALVIGTLSAAQVYTYDPSHPSTTPRILATISDTTPAGRINGITGIAPLSTDAHTDAYAVLGAVWNVSAATAQYPGLYVFDAAKGNANTPLTMRKALDLGAIDTPNGILALPGAPGVFLVADSGAGAVFRVDSARGTVERAVQDPEMALPTDGAVPPIALGINGIGIDAGYLYWTNSGRQTFARLKVTRDGYRARGAKAQVLARVPASQGAGASFDDFQFDGRGNAYITCHPSAVVKVDTRSGFLETVVAGNVTANESGPTSCRFPRNGGAKLYGTSGGGVIFEVDVGRY